MFSDFAKIGIFNLFKSSEPTHLGNGKKMKFKRRSKRLNFPRRYFYWWEPLVSTQTKWKHNCAVRMPNCPFWACNSCCWATQFDSLAQCIRLIWKKLIWKKASPEQTLAKWALCIIMVVLLIRLSLFFFVVLFVSAIAIVCLLISDFVSVYLFLHTDT